MDALALSVGVLISVAPSFAMSPSSLCQVITAEVSMEYKISINDFTCRRI